MEKNIKPVSKNLKYIALVFAAAMVGLDQYFKFLAITYLSNVITVPLIKDFLHLTYIENRGAAFSMLEGKKFFLVGLTSVFILCGIAYLLFGKLESKMLIFAGALVIGGGIGNLVDRIFRGYVIDYIDFRVINFAVFNFADTCVVVGTGLILIYILFIEAKKEAIEKKQKALQQESDKSGNNDGE